MNGGPAGPNIFFDGGSSRRQPVELRFATTMEITRDSVCLASWRFADIRLVDEPQGRLRLSCVTAPALSRLEVSDPNDQRAIRLLCPALNGPGGARPVSMTRIAAWSFAAVAMIAGTIWFGIPLIADGVTDLLPIAWERPLGLAVDNQVRALFPGAPCTNPQGQAALAKLVATLQSAAALPIQPDPVVLRSAIPNAFALPGGRVYVLSAILEKARSPDEIGGVLAHEFGHIAHRDGIRRLIRDGGTGFLVGMLFGDVSGAGAALFAARSLLSAAYSRDIESAADAFAVTVMHRLGRPTAPMGALLTRLTGPHEEGLSILRDHPLTPERVRRLEQDDAAATEPPLLDPAEWHALQGICR